MVNSLGTYYLHRDHRYSVSAVTDSSGAVVERYTYDAYGKVTVRNADGSLKSSQG